MSFLRSMAQRWVDGWFIAIVVTLKLVGFYLPILPLILLAEVISDGGLLLNEGGPSLWLSIPFLILCVLWGPIACTIGNDISRLCKGGNYGNHQEEGKDGTTEPRRTTR